MPANTTANRESPTSSLGPETYDFQFENGRRYHALHAGEYWYLIVPSLMVLEFLSNGGNEKGAKRPEAGRSREDYVSLLAKAELNKVSNHN